MFLNKIPLGFIASRGFLGGPGMETPQEGVQEVTGPEAGAGPVAAIAKGNDWEATDHPGRVVYQDGLLRSVPKDAGPRALGS